MKAGGLQKLTTLDFPGVVSAVVFTQGCNFTCPYCHNPALVTARGRGLLSRVDLLAFLHKRRGLLGGVVISGGEPTLQPNLLDFCREVKKLKYKVKLDSNGSNPAALQALIEARAVDYLAMDLKAPPAAYAAFTGQNGMAERLLKSVALLKESGLPHEFRTTCVSPFVNEEALNELAALAGESPWFLQHARLESTLKPSAAMRAISREELEAALPSLRRLAPRAELRA